jgi:hypothetical protein
MFHNFHDPLKRPGVAFVGDMDFVSIRNNPDVPYSLYLSPNVLYGIGTGGALRSFEVEYSLFERLDIFLFHTYKFKLSEGGGQLQILNMNYTQSL